VAFFLAIDGGGSKTSCAVGDETALLGKGSAGGSNVVRSGEAAAGRALLEAVQQACAAAQVSPRQITRTCVGLSGGDRPETAEPVRRMLAEFVSGEIEIVGDMEIALHAAFGGGAGVIVIAGTGSIAFGRNSRRRTVRAGGWGHAISDEGSGHWIGRCAVSHALRVYDEGENPALLQRVMKAWGTESRDKLILVANAAPGPDFASLFPVVAAAADTGDSTAKSVLAQAGAELSGIAKVVIRRIFAGNEAIPVATAGSVFGNSALVRQVFYNSLRSEYPGVAVNPKVVEPLLGALDLARRTTPRATGA